jgi:diguanylate cyclase (GGDEF)-like protein
MLLPNTSVEEALEVLARIKSTLASLDVEARGIRLFKVSFSAGVTQVRESDKSFDDLYRRADKVLLAAKQSGRDRIEKI